MSLAMWLSCTQNASFLSSWLITVCSPSLLAEWMSFPYLINTWVQIELICCGWKCFNFVDSVEIRIRKPLLYCIKYNHILYTEQIYCTKHTFLLELKLETQNLHLNCL